MSETIEFQGKNLDEAIEAACKHYDLKRDKLEIEILSGGSSGIFGLVGVKKAVVRAKPRGSFKSMVGEGDEQPPARPEPKRPEPKSEPRPEPRAEKPRREERPRQEPRPEPAPKAAAEPAPQVDSDDDTGEPQTMFLSPTGELKKERGEQARRGRRGRGRGRGEREGNRQPDATRDVDGNRVTDGFRNVDGNREPGRPERGQPRRGRERSRREGGEQRPPRREPQAGGDYGHDEDGAPQGIAHLDQAMLEQVAREVTEKLVLPLVENAQITISLLSDRVSVRIEDPENSGLLIGREGQTLASIQYLVNRLVSKRMDASVRVQIDAGDYRENQDERLRQIARHLADKAMATGRTQSTRPMSSYHRRVVHLTLQDDEFVFTRSKGEGAMKRVLIMTKRKDKDGVLVEDAAAEQSYQEYSEAGE